jgi:hypothetical protein
VVNPPPTAPPCAVAARCEHPRNDTPWDTTTLLQFEGPERRHQVSEIDGVAGGAGEPDQGDQGQRLGIVWSDHAADAQLEQNEAFS